MAGARARDLAESLRTVSTRATRGDRACIATAAWLAIGLVIGLVSASARAEPIPNAARGSSDFFRKVSAPDEERALTLAAQAEQLIEQAARTLPADWSTLCRATLALQLPEDSLASLRGKARALYELSRDALRAQAHVQAALTRLERARQLAPSDPAHAHAYARALERVDLPGPPWECRATRRDEEAIAILESLRESHPSYAPHKVTFELGVLLTRTQRFEEAALAYERAAALAQSDSDSSTAFANLAETQMLAGNIEAAIASYNRALSLAHGSREHGLAVFGLALALERNGEHDQALERLQRAFGGATDAFGVLRSSGVFFVPPHEIHAYEALGHASRADSMSALDEPAADQQDAIARELRAAATSYREYLAGASAARRFEADDQTPDEASAQSQASYEATARENLDRVLAQLSRLGKPRDKRAKIKQ